MKILFVANVAKEHIRKFHIPTIKALAESGWEVDVACKLDADIPEARRAFDMCWERSPFSFRTLKGIKQLRHLIAENNYDIVYCHTPVGGLVARFAARKFRKKGLKVVYCAHGLHFFKGAPMLNWLIFYPMEKLMARFTDMFITINDEDFDLVVKRFNRHMAVKRIDGIGVFFERLNMVDRAAARRAVRADLNIPYNAVVLIYVAEILKNKNQSMLIRALDQLRLHGHDCYLLLAGPNHQNGEFKSLAESLGLGDYVKFLGWRSDISDLMAASDICVASSIREGFGINLVEAQYCRLPVVATSNRGHKSIIKDGVNGFLVEIDDVNQMTDRIERLITDKDLYHKMASVDVSQYSSNRIADKIQGYLSDIIK